MHFVTQHKDQRVPLWPAVKRHRRSNDVAGPTQGRLTATPGLGYSSPLAAVRGKHTGGEQASGLSVFAARNKTVKRHLHQLSQVVAISTAQCEAFV